MSQFFGLSPWFRWQILGLLLLAQAVAMVGLPGLSQEVFQEQIAPSQKAEKVIQLPEAGYWCLILMQQGVDLKLSLTTASLKEPLAVDSPLDEWGSERLTLAMTQPGQVQATITTQAQTGAAGNFQLKTLYLGPLSAKDRPDILAELATTRAGQIYEENNPKTWVKALEAHQQEAKLRAQADQPPLEARALYCVGVLYRLLGKRAEAQAFVDRALILQRKLGHRMGVGFSANELGLLALGQRDFKSAELWFQEAVSVRRQLEEPGLQAASQNNICLTLLNQGRFQKAVPCLQEALALSKRGQRISTQLSVHTNLGHLFDRLAQPSLARDHYQAALALQGPGPGWGKARLHNNLGAFYMRLSNFQDAFFHYFEALTLFRQLEEKGWEARALNNLGSAYIQLDQPERALPFLTTALPLRRADGNKRGELVTLINLGVASESQGAFQKGLGFLEKARSLAEEMKRPRDLGRTNLATARILLHLQRFDDAFKYAQQALQDLGGAKFPAEMAEAHLVNGTVLQAKGQWEKALQAFARAEALYRQQESDDGLIFALYLSARAQRDLKRIPAAKKTTLEAIERIETLRAKMPLAPLRRSFFARHHQVYTLMVELVLLDSTTDASSLWQALDWSERGKAREFLDIQRQAGASFGLSKGGERDNTATDLGMAVHAKARLLDKMKRDREPTEAVDKAGLALEQALFQLERHQQQIAPAALPRQPPSMTPELIQAKLAPQTQLLVFCLGESRSFAWRISATEIIVDILPKRRDLEAMATKAYREMAQLSTAPRKQRHLTALARILVKPLKNQAELKKLIVVPDGSLHLIPFGVMPLDVQNQTNLIQQGVELTYLPSVAALVAPKQAPALEPRPASLAVFADPVFQPSDPRLQRPPQEAKRESPFGVDFTYGRLPAAGLEAQEIQKLAGDALAVTPYLGLDANLERVFSAEMTQFKYLHFATHTQIDFTYPELTALVLSLVDAQGSTRPGHLRIHQLTALRLRAELVVLSGCETAIGKAFRGEGLAGLARGFMEAGANQVIASLWPVPDQATHQFMNRFYQSLLVDRHSPATALRTAQQAMQNTSRYRHPFYWGGWALFGHTE